jgi:putative addiction module killer protein
MYTVYTSEKFQCWFNTLRDIHAKQTIARGLKKIEAGNLGDWKAIGGNLFELRLHNGPGYRLYFTRTGNEIIFLLCGGDKSSQQKDIEAAKRILKAMGEGH